MHVFFNISALILRLGISSMYFLCAFLEYYAFRIIFSQNDSMCIFGKEISDDARTFMTLQYAVLLPDMILAVIGLLIWKLYNASLCVVFNIVFGVIGCYNGNQLASVITCCTNPAMDYMNSGAFLSAAAGSVHIGIAFATHFLIENGDGYCLSRQAEGWIA